MSPQDKFNYASAFVGVAVVAFVMMLAFLGVI